MNKQLIDLIGRMQRMLSDPDNRPLWVHWSDVTLLVELNRELVESNAYAKKLGDQLWSNSLAQTPSATSMFSVRLEPEKVWTPQGEIPIGPPA